MTFRSRDELLAAYRRGREPAPAVRHEIWSRLEAEIDDPSEVPAELPAAAPKDARARRRVFVAVAVLLAAGLVAWLEGSLRTTVDSAPEPSVASLAADRRMATPQSQPVAQPATSPPVPSPSPPPIDPDESVPAVELPSAPRRRRTRVTRHPQTSPEFPPSAAPRPSTLRAEAAFLERARGALRSGRPNVARSVLDEYERAFPRGLLSEEASALRAMLRCTKVTHDPAAVEAFAARYPNSVFRRQVEAACTTKPPGE